MSQVKELREKTEKFVGLKEGSECMVFRAFTNDMPTLDQAKLHPSHPLSHSVTSEPSFMPQFTPQM